MTTSADSDQTAMPICSITEEHNGFVGVSFLKAFALSKNKKSIAIFLI